LQPLVESHKAALLDTWEGFQRAPVTSLSTALIIAIALLLPNLLNIIGNNLTQLDDYLQGSTQATLYLYNGVSEPEGISISEHLLEDPLVSSTRYISRQQALDQFTANSGLGGILDGLGDNPLPASIVIIPKRQPTAASQALFGRLEALPEVEFMQVDLNWLQRLAALRDIVSHTGLMLTLILGLGVLLIVGNTIRLSIESRKQEIQVLQLVGGTDSFIIRPYLYAGLVLGITGGLLTWMMIIAILAVFDLSFDNLLSLYSMEFTLQGLGLKGGLILLATGSLLGWSGALLATSRHLRGKPL